MNTPSIIGKSILLATLIFWLFNYTQLDFQGYLLVPLSLIPISICVSLVILITIFPWFTNSKKSAKQIFNIGFPIYSILLFIVCVYFGFESDFENFITGFLASAYITTCYAWLKFSKLGF